MSPTAIAIFVSWRKHNFILSYLYYYINKRKRLYILYVKAYYAEDSKQKTWRFRSAPANTRRSPNVAVMLGHRLLFSGDLLVTLRVEGVTWSISVCYDWPLPEICHGDTAAVSHCSRCSDSVMSWKAQPFSQRSPAHSSPSSEFTEIPLAGVPCSWMSWYKTDLPSKQHTSIQCWVSVVDGGPTLDRCVVFAGQWCTNHSQRPR